MGSIYATDIVAVNVNEQYEKKTWGDPEGDRWFSVTQPSKYAEGAAIRKAMGL